MLQSLFEKLRNISLHLTFPTRCALACAATRSLFSAKYAKAHTHAASGLSPPASFPYISAARFHSAPLFLCAFAPLREIKLTQRRKDAKKKDERCNVALKRTASNKRWCRCTRQSEQVARDGLGKVSTYFSRFCVPSELVKSHHGSKGRPRPRRAVPVRARAASITRSLHFSPRKSPP